MFTLYPYNADCTFENIKVMRGNRLALAAALAVAENPGRDYSPLVLFEESKTTQNLNDMSRILLAIGNRLEKAQPEKIVLYVNCTSFLQQKNFTLDNCERYVKKFDRVDVLFIDGLQNVLENDVAQEFLQFVINSFYEKGKQIVITLNKHPRDIASLHPTLKSQMMYGLIVEVRNDDKPDDALNHAAGT